jgi:hypothetical protein
MQRFVSFNRRRAPGTRHDFVRDADQLAQHLVRWLLSR